MRRLAVIVLCAAAVAACSDDKSDSGSASSEATTTTSPLDLTTTTPTTVPSGPATTAQAAADGLFDAWQDGDRDAASRFARERAIERMFAQPYVKTADGADYDKVPCEPEGGQFACRWRYEGGSIQLTVEGVAGGGFVVDDVIRTAD